MPNIDGLEFAKLCKEHPPFQDSPIIGLSEKSQKIKTDLISNFISKSHHSELIETIYSLLKVHDDR